MSLQVDDYVWVDNLWGNKYFGQIRKIDKQIFYVYFYKHHKIHSRIDEELEYIPEKEAMLLMLEY